MSADNWRTHPDDFAVLATEAGLVIDGLPAVDVDACTNSGSQVLCRVGLCGDGNHGPITGLDWSVVKQTPVNVGGGHVNASGLGSLWPGELTFFCNPPFSTPAPFVCQWILHCMAGGRGAGLAPCNMPEGAWTQALLLLAGAQRFAWGPGFTDATFGGPGGRLRRPPCGKFGDIAPVLQALFASKGVPTSLQRYCAAVCAAPPVGRFGLFIPSRRLGFIDPDGTYQSSNRQGTMGVMWGLPEGSPLVGIHTVVWARRENPQPIKFPALAGHER
jgi:hypothetical protein